MWKRPRDAELVEYFRRTLTEPVVKRTGVPKIDHEQASTPCPCQFLIQQQFELPDPLRRNVHTVIESSYLKAKPPHIPDREDRARHLNVRVSHPCGSAAAEEPHVRWGFAIEPSPQWGFRKGPDRVFEEIQEVLGPERFPHVWWIPGTEPASVQSGLRWPTDRGCRSPVGLDHRSPGRL
jgi:hypothetical protein